MTTVDDLKRALAGQYDVERELGSGGMATVYLATDVKHQRQVAIKVLHPELAAILGPERFVAEIRLTASLQHPHIMPLFDSGSADGMLYYVMPRIEGETLRDRLQRENQLPVDDALRIATEVASALDYAHRHGVVHRDIKPENILLHEMSVHVADFGIALALQHAGGPRMTQTGMSLGTPHYMSPEQAMGDRNVDARADIYALGCVVYEMLVGEPPFTGPNAQAIIAKVITDAPRPLRELRPSVQPGTAQAVARALQKIPADRFQSAAEFSQALTNPSPATAAVGTPPPLQLAQAQSASRRTWQIATGVMALACVTALAFPRGSRSIEAEAAVARFRLGFLDGERPSLQDNRGLALSRDGRRIAYVGGDTSDGLWIRNVNELNGRRLPQTDGATAPFFSPDGKKVAFFTRNPAALKVVSIGEGNPVVLVRDSTQVYGGDWGDDGMLYFTGTSGMVMRVPEGGGDTRRVSVLNVKDLQTEHDFPQILPGGKALLVMAWRGDFLVSGLAVVDLATGTTKPLVRGVFGWYAAPGHLLSVTPDGALLNTPFDTARLETTGPSVQLIDGLHVGFTSAAPNTAYAANGSFLYQAGNGISAELDWVPIDNRGTPAPTGISTLAITYAASPDGKRIAITIQSGTGSDIWVRDIESKIQTRLTFDAKGNRSPIFTHDGKQIVYVSARSGRPQPYIRAADGTGQDSLLFAASQRISDVALSADGKWAVFAGRTLTFETHLYARRLDGGDTTVVPIAAAPFIQSDAAFSPDGRWLAYRSDESGTPQVYVRPFPDVASGREQISSLSGTNPHFSADGKRLFFTEGSATFYVVELDTRNGFHHGVPRKVISGGGYTTSPVGAYAVDATGERMLLARQHKAGAGEFVMVMNFAQEIQAHAKGKGVP